jgi:hypothetical protein
MSTPTRIPPLSEQLEFARNTETRRVHVLCYGPARDWVPSATREDPKAAVMMALISTPCRMLCGAKLFVGVDDSQRAVWEAGDDFTDDDLCIACVRALGDQQWRAFHADNRGSS